MPQGASSSRLQLRTPLLWIRLTSLIKRVSVAMFVAAIASPVDAIASDFATDVEPIFQEHCLGCHGPDEQNSQFRLDRLASMLAGGDSGEPAIVPRNPAASYLVKLIKRQEPGMEMPPDQPITDDEISRIERWISAGAKTPEHYGPPEAEQELDHWAFQPIQRSSSGGGIDPMVKRKLAEHQLHLSPTADRRTLIRRLYLVMLGLPPTPEQVDAFLSDERVDAWPRLVEKILASPHYGERWASHWLDLVRFGETNGFETNRERPNAWHYRDWVIRSFNEDKPYDQFVREQIAGDAVGADIGTSFLVAGPRDIVKGQDPLLGQVQRMNELDDMINTTGTAFLGLSTGCARCHNHKFDPISQRDYYALQAVFAGVNHGERSLPPSDRVTQRMGELDREIDDLTQKLRPFVPAENLASIVLRESDADPLFDPQGKGTITTGTRNEFSGDDYTWWKLRPEQDHLVYSARAEGTYRIWISWGAGFETHCSDARYVIRSREGEREIARVDQQLTASATESIAGIPRWSGFFDAGVHPLKRDDTIVLVGGQSGTALTADTIVLQPDVESAIRPPSARPPSTRVPVSASINEERFPSRKAKYVRFVIEATNGGEACIDELEIFSGSSNVALASSGAKATSSSDFQHPLHKLEHINDGEFGNRNSWIVGSKDGGWVQIEFPEPVSIDRVVWARDRQQQFSDRVATRYRIEAALLPDEWTLLASSADRRSAESRPTDRQRYQFDGLPPKQAERGRRWFERLQTAEQQRAQLRATPLVYAGTFSQPGTTYRLYRGEPGARREPVAPDTLSAFGSLELDADSPEQQRRVAFANWVASKENPLTARVIVNRLWQFHFGTGLVDTPSDFGNNGTPPSHPELLDWLAAELIDNNWSLKHIHRLILHSDTWRQDNRPRKRALTIDAASRLLWRFPPRRGEAEIIRDSILAVSGTLDLGNRGGPGFSAFEVQLENVRHYHPKQDFGPDDWRRMVYMTKVRQEKDQVFGVFDCPDASMVVPKRSRSTTPLQALNLLNSHFVMQQAKIFSERLQSDPELQSDPQRIARAWGLCFSRPPTPEETSDARAFIDDYGWVQFTRALLNANEFVFIP